jgi:hypothetical protein
LNEPASESVIMMPFVETGRLGVGFRCDTLGRVARSAGYKVRNDGKVAPTEVRLMFSAVALAGNAAHWPDAPTPTTVIVSPAPNGVLRAPTLVASRVSTSRHGSTGVTDDAMPAPDAWTRPMPPAPAATAIAAPIAAQRERTMLVMQDSPSVLAAAERGPATHCCGNGHDGPLLPPNRGYPATFLVARFFVDDAAPCGAKR